MNSVILRTLIVSSLLMAVSLHENSLADSGLKKRIEPVYGAGPSTHLVTLFFSHFSNKLDVSGIEFSVPKRSTKHAGGIRASSRYFFGRTGRPLKDQEKAQGKWEIFLGRVPLGFATSPVVTLPSLESTDITKIFSGEVSNWKDLGGPDASIVLLGREKTEASLNELSSHFPILLDAQYKQILKRDHAVVNYLKSPAGRYAIGYGAVSNFIDLNPVDVLGTPLGIKVGLVVDNKNSDNPIIKAVKEYANSEQWHQIVENEGYFVAVNSNKHRLLEN